MGTEACSSNFKCFDLPTNYEPSQELVGFASGIPGATAEVRKLYCSGNIDRTQGPVTAGQLLDGKFVIGSACFSGDENCIFHSQIESAVIVHGTPFSPVSGTPDANVVSTIITQGGTLPIPNNPLATEIDILSPGSLEKVGELIGTTNGAQELAPDSMLVQTNVDADFRLNDGSRLLVHNVQILTHRLPELDQIVRNTLQTDFANVPGVTPRLLEEGVLFFNTTGESHSDLINCDPSTGEATGTFQDLCNQFPRMRVNFICTAAALTDLNSSDGFMFTGVWTLVKE
jgi:hypothetical protein